MGEQFTDKAIGQMPEVSRTNLFDIETISQLTDYCFDKALRRHVCRTKDFGRVSIIFFRNGVCKSISCSDNSGATRNKYPPPIFRNII